MSFTCGDTSPRGRRTAPTCVPLDQRQSAVKQRRVVQRGFYCIAERAKLETHTMRPLDSSAVHRRRVTPAKTRANQLFSGFTSFLLPFFSTSFVAHMSVEDALFRSAFSSQRLHARLYTRWLPRNVNDLEELDAGRVRISL